MSYQIAIDGPAGAGKSTIAKRVAAELKFVYVDTGAMYRAMALLCLRNGIDKNDEKKVTEACDAALVNITYLDGAQVVMLNGENVNPFIRTQEVGDMASAISVYKGVREKLVKLQQELAEKVGVSRQTINAIEKGDYNPTINLCIAICKALNKTLDELFWEAE